MYTHLCMQACVEIRGHKVSIFYHSLPYSFETESLPEPEACIVVVVLFFSLQVPVVLLAVTPHWCWRYRWYATCHTDRCGDPNSGPHNCAASTLNHKPSLQPCSLVCCFCLFILIQGLTLQFRLFWNSLHNCIIQPWNPSNPPTSASQILGVEAWA